MTNDTNTYAAPADDDWLDATLAAAGREHRAQYIADDGFTAGVLAKLPPPPALPAWRRRAVATLWTAAAAGFALALPGTFAELGREAFRIVAAQPVSLAQIAAGILALGIGSWTAAYWALRRT
jgi:hypothetical protein